jgi:hypothetical protein
VDQQPIPRPAPAPIRELNDTFRQTFVGGVIMITPGIEALSLKFRAELLRRVRTFDQFDTSSDPYAEHDFGSLEIDNERVFWKIDYYDRAVQHGSDDPSDSAKTTRVLTIMLASEY